MTLFLISRFSEAVRPAADQGSPGVLSFEQMDATVADLGTQLPSNCIVHCGEQDFHSPSLMAEHAVQRDFHSNP